MRLTISLSLLAAVLALAACGSSTPAATAGSTSAQGDSAKEGQVLAFAKCMRSHGVSNFPDPTGGKFGLQIQRTPNSTSVNGVEVNAPAFQSAMQACRSYLPNGGHPTAAQTAEVKARALAMARCMRSHGVPTFPDPQFQTGPGGGFGVRLAGPAVNPSSPAFQAAQKVCGPIFKGAAVTAKAP